MSDASKRDGWEVFRKNIKFVRKYYKLTQENVSEGLGCTRGAYQHNEAEGYFRMLPIIIDFWYRNYGITPNDLLLEHLDEEKMKEIEKRINVERLKKRVSVKVRKARYR